MFRRNRTTNAQNGPQITGRGVTPAHGNGYMSSERATEWSVTPSGFIYNTPVSRGYTPACSLNSPSGFVGGIFVDNHSVNMSNRPSVIMSKDKHVIMLICLYPPLICFLLICLLPRFWCKVTKSREQNKINCFIFLIPRRSNLATFVAKLQKVHRS